MKNIFHLRSVTIFLLLLILGAGIAVAVDFSPQGNIVLKNRYGVNTSTHFCLGLQCITNWSQVNSTAGNTSWNESYARSLFLQNGSSANFSSLQVNDESVCTSSNGLCNQTETSPGGSDTYIQFNDGGSFGGSANLTWNGTVLNITGEAHGIGCIDYDADGSCEIDSDGSNIEISPNDDGTTSWDIGIAYIAAGPSTTYPRLHRRGISLTTPMTTRGDDTNTGMGVNGADQGSLVAGGSAVLTFADDVGDETILVNNPSAANIGLTVQGAAAQSANLQEWQDSSGNVVSRIDPDGIASFGLETSTAGDEMRLEIDSSTNAANHLVTITAKDIDGGAGGINAGIDFKGQNNGAFRNIARMTPDDGLRMIVQTGSTIEAQIKNVQATSTNPVFVPDSSDGDTGIGWDSSNILSLVAGGVNVANVTTTGLNVSGDVCVTGGNCLSTAGGGGTPGGSDTYIQFNDGGSFGGNANLTFTGQELNVTSDFYIKDDDGDISLQYDPNQGGGRLTIGPTVANTGVQLVMYPAGSAITPEYTWVTDTNTGMYRAGTDKIGFSVGTHPALILGDSSYDEAALITPQAATDIGLTVQGAAAQSANLQEWQDSAGTVLVSVQADGDFVPSGTGSESIKVGSGTTASQTRSLAIGAGATASGGQHVMAIGSYSQATITQATAIGYDARATATDTLAIGYATRADQNDCIALGKGADCTKTNQLVLGSTSIDADKLTEIYWPNNDVSLQFNETGVDLLVNASLNVTGTTFGSGVCLMYGPYGCALVQNSTSTYIVSPDGGTIVEASN